MANYPTGVSAFTTKNAGDVIQPSHINGLQDEISAIEDGLLNGTAPLTSSHATFPSVQVNGNSTFVGSILCSSQVTVPNQPAFNLFSTVAYSGIAASTVSVSFEQEALDQGGFHSTGANPDRVTVPTGSSGLYWLHGAVFFLNYGHSGALAVTKNGTRIVGNQIFASSIAGQTCRVDLLARLDAADVLRLEIIGSAGSTWSAGSGALGFESRFQGTKLS
jgi:hypothetical protein